VVFHKTLNILWVSFEIIKYLINNFNSDYSI
jgi:hypothetical protein